MRFSLLFLFFFFNDTATTEIYTLSLHDALPIGADVTDAASVEAAFAAARERHGPRSEEHTSELQSPCNLVCRLLLEKKHKYATAASAFRATSCRKSSSVSIAAA